MTASMLEITGAVVSEGRRTDAAALRSLVEDRKTCLSELPPRSLLRFPAWTSTPFIVDLIACQELGLSYAPHEAAFAWESHTLSDGEHIEGVFSERPPHCGYVIPTSGSTGEPKAILGRWDGLSDYIAHYAELFKNRRGLRFAALTWPNFDPFLREIHTPLCAGHELHVPDDRAALNDPASLSDWIQRHEIQVLHLVPTVARILFSTTPPLPTIEFVMLAGEPLFWRDVDLVRSRIAPGAAIYNLYGPSETTLSKLQFRASAVPAGMRPASAPVPVGKPLGQARVIVVGPQGPCGVHEHGEILIRHALPSHGYLRRSDGVFSLHSPFERNPFRPQDETPVYRTGDLGYLDEAHDIVCIGRNDSVVKIRGLKVSMTRIEGAARDIAGVDAAVAQVQQDAQGSARVVLFFTGTCAPAELKQALRPVLGDAELPGRLVRLDSMPRTHSGKIARAKLQIPDDEPARVDDGQALAVVRDLFARIVGTLDNEQNPSFLRSGGQSIDAAQIVSALNLRFQCDLRLRDFFECDEADAIAARVLARTGKGRHAEPAPRILDEAGTLPLLESQRRFARAIALRRDVPAGSHRFQFPWACTFDATLNPDRFAAAVRETIESCWAMNVRFDFRREVQERLALRFEVARIDLGEVDSCNAARHPSVQQAWKAPFALERERPVRATLFRLAGGQWLFVLVNHVMASDGTTRTNLLAEIAARHAGAIPLPCRFREYHAAQRFPSEAIADAIGRLRARPWPAALSHDLWRVPVADDAPTRRLSFELPSAEVAAIRAYCEGLRVSVASFLLHALTRVQRRYLAELGEVVLVSSARRSEAADASVVGCLTDSTMFLALDESLMETHAALMDALDASEASFLQAAASLFPTVEPTLPGAFPVIFAPQPDLGRELDMEQYRPSTVSLGDCPWIWPLEFYPVLSRERIVIHVNYADDERLARIAAALTDDIRVDARRLVQSQGAGL